MIIIAKVLKAANNFIKVLRFGAVDVNTPVAVLPYGVDSKPIKNKRGVVAGTQKKGINVILGYLLKSDKTKSGEIRHYATDDDGVEKFYVHLKKDGTCEIGGDVDNLVRYSELQTAFDELKNNFNALVTAFNSHVHATAAVGLPVIPTPVPNVIPAASSSADITPAKIDEVKSL